MLRFVRGGPAKWYAATDSGEIAWAESQGAYQWHRNPETQTLERTDYGMGEDRQASDRSGPWTHHGNPEPKVRGFQAALLRYNQIPN